MEQRLRAAIEKGLNSETHPYASVKCFPTYVRDLPCGTEMGKFLALDLGGTNFRVVLIDIGPDSKFEMDSEIYAISKEIMEGSGEGLMDHIAECLAEFAKDRGIDQEVLPLGFTFRRSWRFHRQMDHKWRPRQCDSGHAGTHRADARCRRRSSFLAS